MILALSIVAAVVGAGIASVAGFGIGSLVTPVLSIELGIKLAVALVALPHFVATAVRFWTLRRQIDRSILLRFGLASAVGGLSGAFIHAYVSAPYLAILLGVLLLFAGAAAVAGWAERLRLPPRWLIAGGLLSGLLGGAVGNQGGVRSAALLGTDLEKESFVATATAVALLVDIARIPVYAATQGSGIVSHWPVVVALVAAVVLGTFLGWRLLLRIPDHVFRRMVGVLLVLLGLFMLYQGIRG